MTLYESSSVLWAVCDDLVDSVQNRHHCISLKILRWVLLPTWEVSDEVPQSIAPCNGRDNIAEIVSVQVKRHACRCELQACTYEVFIPSVHRQVAKSNSHGSHHFVHIWAQQLHQNRQPFLFSHCGSDVAGPLRKKRHKTAEWGPA